MTEYALLIAAGSGLCFSLIGVAIRGASGRRIDPLRVFCVLAVCGCGFFVPGAFSVALRWPAVGLGIIAGITQYAAARLYRQGLTLGPLTPLWCALQLSFLEPVAWAALVRHVPLTNGHWMALFLATAGVLFSARLARNGASATTGSLSWRYLALLLTVLILNGIANICLKEADVRGWHDAYSQTMVALYGMAALMAWLEARRSPARVETGWSAALLWGLLGAAGSIGGMSLLSRCLAGPAGLVFTVQAAASIAGAALASVLLFHERATRTWWATVLLVLGAVIAAGWW